MNLFDFNWSYLCRHAPVKKQTQYANRAKAFAPHQNFGPAISEAAAPRSALSNCRIPLAGLRRGLASSRRPFDNQSTYVSPTECETYQMWHALYFNIRFCNSMLRKRFCATCYARLVFSVLEYCTLCSSELQKVPAR